MIPKLTTTEAEVVKELACLIVPNPERAILQFQYVKINLMVNINLIFLIRYGVIIDSVKIPEYFISAKL